MSKVGKLMLMTYTVAAREGLTSPRLIELLIDDD
jgi:hypothetical protein